MTYKEFIKDVQQRLLHLYPEEEGRAIAVRLLEHFCNISRYEHLINPQGMIEEGLLNGDIKKALKELSNARPLQYVIGYAEFYGRSFFVEEGVLIPRPETEEIVRLIVDDVKKTSFKYSIHILDAACGSGCIGITLACELFNKKKTHVDALDFSDKALEVTRRNASSNEVAGFSCFKSDILKGPDSQKVIKNGTLDILVSNPPYVRESERPLMRKNVLDFEPAEALFVPDDDPLKFYKALAVWGSKLLKPSGKIYLEINESLGVEVSALLRQSWFEDVQLHKDFCGKPRMVKATLTSDKISL